jgi:hypothetical protein
LDGEEIEMGNRRSRSTIIGAGVGGVAAIAAYAFVMRPWLLRWGTTLDEAGQPLPGDELVARPILETTRAITIQASATEIWPWLVQMGQGRGGFYSYDRLENLSGLDIHNADTLEPKFQNLQIGDLIPFWRGGGVQVIGLDPPRALVLAGRFDGAGLDELRGGGAGGSWVFVLRVLNEHTTRLIVRTRVANFPPFWVSVWLVRVLLEPTHFIMERRMLMGIKERVDTQAKIEEKA